MHHKGFHAFLEEAAALYNCYNPPNTPQESPAASVNLVSIFDIKLKRLHYLVVIMGIIFV